MKKKLLHDLLFLKAGEIVESVDSIDGFIVLIGGDITNRYLLQGIEHKIVSDLWNDSKWFESVDDNFTICIQKDNFRIDCELDDRFVIGKDDYEVFFELSELDSLIDGLVDLRNKLKNK